MHKFFTSWVSIRSWGWHSDSKSVHSASRFSNTKCVCLNKRWEFLLLHHLNSGGLPYNHIQILICSVQVLSLKQKVFWVEEGVILYSGIYIMVTFLFQWTCFKCPRCSYSLLQYTKCIIFYINHWLQRMLGGISHGPLQSHMCSNLIKQEWEYSSTRHILVCRYSTMTMQDSCLVS